MNFVLLIFGGDEQNATGGDGLLHPRATENSGTTELQCEQRFARPAVSGKQRDRIERDEPRREPLAFRHFLPGK